MPSGASPRATSASAARTFSAWASRSATPSHTPSALERRLAVLAGRHRRRRRPSRAGRRRARRRGRSPGRSSIARGVRRRRPARAVAEQVAPGLRRDQVALGEIVHPVEVGRDEDVGRRALLDLLGERRARGIGDRRPSPLSAAQSAATASSAFFRLAAANTRTSSARAAAGAETSAAATKSCERRGPSTPPPDRFRRKYRPASAARQALFPAGPIGDGGRDRRHLVGGGAARLGLEPPVGLEHAGAELGQAGAAVRRRRRARSRPAAPGSRRSSPRPAPRRACSSSPSPARRRRSSRSRGCRRAGRPCPARAPPPAPAPAGCAAREGSGASPSPQAPSLSVSPRITVTRPGVEEAEDAAREQRGREQQQWRDGRHARLPDVPVTRRTLADRPARRQPPAFSSPFPDAKNGGRRGSPPMPMEKTFDAPSAEPAVSAAWEAAGAFRAGANARPGRRGPSASCCRRRTSPAACTWATPSTTR